MKQYTSIPEEEQENVLAVMWIMIGRLHEEARNNGDVLARRDVEAYYRLWNRITGDNHMAAWE